MPVMNAAGVGVRGRVWRSCIAGFQGLGFISFSGSGHACLFCEHLLFPQGSKYTSNTYIGP